MTDPAVPGAGLAQRVVEILHDTGTGWRVGSGLVVRDGIVLTAAHVVSTRGELLVRFRGSAEYRARVSELPSGQPAIDEQLDLAILRVVDGTGPAEPVAFARLRDNPVFGTPNLDGCFAVGFPRFQERVRAGRDRPVRDSVRVDGYIPSGEGLVEGLATLRVRDAPHDFPVPRGTLADSPWQGMSGAVVFAGRFAVGVVSEHHPPAGTNALTVVPLGWLDRRPDAADWWALLGVANPTALPVLPAVDRAMDDPVVSDEEVLDRLRRMTRQLPEFTLLSTPFGGLPSDFYQPRVLRPARSRAPSGATAPEPGTAVVDESVGHLGTLIAATQRVVILGGPGLGKTQLLYDVGRRMAAGEYPGIPLFVRLYDLARRGERRDLFSFAVEESFGEQLAPGEIERITTVLRRQVDDDGAVFLFDGLDEVPVHQHDDVLARVRRTRRFVLTSRPIGSVQALQDASATYRIEELTDQAVASFIDRWAARSPDVEGLKDRLEADRVLAGLARLPQLLTLLCWLWRQAPATQAQSRIELIANAVDESFGRAVRLMRLADGDEELVPVQVRRALRTAALLSVEAGDGTSHRISREELLTVLAGTGSPERTGTLFAFARRSGLVVPTDTAGGELEFVHDVFRAFLAGEALARDRDPGPAIDRLLRRLNPDDVLSVAAALDPDRIPRMVLDRVAAAEPDIFGMNWRTAALCMNGVGDLRALEEPLRPVADAVLAGAARWWSRGRFIPAVASVRTRYMVGRLRENLDDDDAYVRWAAVLGLAATDTATALPLLVARLPVEPWSAVQSAIVSSLGRLRDRSAVGVLMAHYERRLAATTYTDYGEIGESLARLGAEQQLRQILGQLPDEPATDLVIGALPYADPPLADEILAVLNDHGVTLTQPEAQQRYLGYLRDRSATTDQRVRAVSGLLDAGTPEAVGAVLDVFVADPDPQVWEAAANGLAALKGDVDFRDVAQHLLELIHSDSADDRDFGLLAVVRLWTSAAREAMSALRFPEPDELVDELLRHPEPLVRTAAAVLAVLGGVAPVPVLAGLMEEDAAVAREAAIAAVGYAGVTDLADAVAQHVYGDGDRGVRFTAMAVLADLVPGAALDALLSPLDADDPAERIAAARAIGMLDGSDGVAALVRRLGVEEVPAVRLTLLDQVIRRWRDGPVPSELAQAVAAGLDSGDEQDRGLAALATGVLGLTGHLPRLRTMLTEDPSEDVRDHAAEGYGRLASLDDLAAIVAETGTQGASMELIAPLAYALDHRDSELVRRLRELIGAAGGDTIVSDRGVVVAYPAHKHSILHDRPPPAIEELTAALANGDADQRWAAVYDLADRWDEGDVLSRLALAMLDSNRAVAEEAARRLEELSRAHTITHLGDDNLGVLNEPDTLDRLLGLPDDYRDAVLWLLAQREFLPGLMRAFTAGHTSARVILWDIAERHGLRLFADGRLLLASGEEQRWDESLTPR